MHIFKILCGILNIKWNYNPVFDLNIWIAIAKRIIPKIFLRLDKTVSDITLDNHPVALSTTYTITRLIAIAIKI